MSINKIIGRLLLLNHINASEAIELLGKENDLDCDYNEPIYETEDDYAKLLDEAEELIEPISDEEMDSVIAECPEIDDDCNCCLCTGECGEETSIEERFESILNKLENILEEMKQPYIPETINLPYIQITTPDSYYENCGCNPKNGGSGVCGCVRPTPYYNSENVSCTVANCQLCKEGYNHISSTLNVPYFVWANQTVTNG